MRMFEGNQYWNCDDLTEAEMQIVAHWEQASEQERQVIRDKCHWKADDLYLMIE